MRWASQNAHRAGPPEHRPSDNMSNVTQNSRQSGDNRNRRSRGGKNRNSNQQDNRRGGDRGAREQRGSQSDRSEEFRPQGPRPPRTYAPVKLSWWQKLLKAVGLYKAPAPPARRERTPNDSKSNGEAREPKSNIRNARSNEGNRNNEAARSNEGARPERTGEDRPKRNARGGERSRGGDPSTVESTRVYVGNLSYDVSEQDLQELFKGIGGVRNVEIVYNRSTHRSKGYGFVEMLHKDEAIRCVEVLNDQPFMGRKLTVSGAKSKGQDERDENEERPEREPRPVVLAPLPSFTPAPAVVQAEVAAEVAAEPQIQTIVETVAESAVVEIPVPEASVVVESAPDLVAKYGFDEPKEETKQA
jgi:hypothetical protein